MLAQKTNRCGFLRSLGLGGPEHGALRNRRANQTETGGIEFQKPARPYRAHRSLGEVVHSTRLMTYAHRETANHRRSIRQANTRGEEWTHL